MTTGCDIADYFGSTIAHRLSTIKDANKILVMGGGEILEQGTHNSLLENENGPVSLISKPHS